MNENEKAEMCKVHQNFGFVTGCEICKKSFCPLCLSEDYARKNEDHNHQFLSYSEFRKKFTLIEMVVVDARKEKNSIIEIESQMKQIFPKMKNLIQFNNHQLYHQKLNIVKKNT